MERISLGNTDVLSKAINDDKTIVFHDYTLNSATGQVRVTITISAMKSEKGIIEGARVKIGYNPNQTYTENLKSFQDFFEVASNVHGLRGLLNIIKGASQLLRENRPEDMEIKEFTDYIDEAVKEMDNIVSRFMNLPAEIEISDIDINAVLKKVKNLTSPLALKNKVKTFYSYGDLPLIRANAQQIEQSIINVINNAIEAMTGGGEIRITSGIKHLQGNNFAVISISDTGPGIMSTKRLNSYKTKRGFGLTLTRLILHCNGGLMKIKDSKAGTTVRLYLPVKRE